MSESSTSHFIGYVLLDHELFGDWQEARLALECGRVMFGGMVITGPTYPMPEGLQRVTVDGESWTVAVPPAPEVDCHDDPMDDFNYVGSRWHY